MNQPGNLLEPLTFADGEIDKFIWRNKCAICRSHLNKYPVPGRLWKAVCPNCGPVLATNHTHTSTVERIEAAEYAARVELRD